VTWKAHIFLLQFSLPGSQFLVGSSFFVLRREAEDRADEIERVCELAKIERQPKARRQLVSLGISAAGPNAR
jgi:hypothetical protein